MRLAARWTRGQKEIWSDDLGIEARRLGTKLAAHMDNTQDARGACNFKEERGN